MKIKIIKNGTNTEKEFLNKEELFEFVKKEVADTIFSSDEMEDLKIKVLSTENYNKFAIQDLLDLIDYKLKK